MFEAIEALLKRNTVLFITALVTFELLLNAIIINKVGYTEIDWVAYMQEVNYFLNGERDYYLIKGDTGPLVYPAGFVYFYSAIHWITDGGANVRLVLVVYLSTDAPIPRWILILLCLSKRVHSIYVLRMFNDTVAVLLGYIALYLFINQRWRFGCFFYSLSVSVKMNMLLQAPGLLLVLLLALGLHETIVCLVICATVQLVVGFPFLSNHPVAYLLRSFDIGRVFEYKWTVNYRFLPEYIFTSKTLSVGLLLLTILGMVVLWRKWVEKAKYSKKTITSWDLLGPQKIDRHFIISTIMISNFIGIAFARSLHYQFYCWYYHSLPYILWTCTTMPDAIRVALLIVIEIAFNVYPSTPRSSALLQIAHVVVLAALYLHPAPSILRTISQEPANPNRTESKQRNKRQVSEDTTAAISDESLGSGSIVGLNIRNSIDLSKTTRFRRHKE